MNYLARLIQHLEEKPPVRAFEVKTDLDGGFFQAYIVNGTEQVEEMTKLLPGKRKVMGGAVAFVDALRKPSAGFYGWIVIADTFAEEPGVVGHELSHAAQFYMIAKKHGRKSLANKSTFEPLANAAFMLHEDYWRQIV